MKVFISHADSDKGLVRNVAAVLQKAGSDVRDEDLEILPGDNWAER